MGRRGPRWAFLSTAGKKGEGSVIFKRERRNRKSVSFSLPFLFLLHACGYDTYIRLKTPPCSGKKIVSPTSAPHVARFPTNYIEGPLIEWGGEQNRIRILIFQRAICRGIFKRGLTFPPLFLLSWELRPSC